MKVPLGVPEQSKSARQGVQDSLRLEKHSLRFLSRRPTRIFVNYSVAQLGGRSVASFTEALGEQSHVGHVALLVNEHSASAAEMVAGFVSENRLGTVVGSRTPGRLVATSAFAVGHGYRIALPVAAYYTWQGRNLEGTGVTPDVEEPFSPEACWRGVDTQLDRALEAVS